MIAFALIAIAAALNNPLDESLETAEPSGEFSVSATFAGSGKAQPSQTAEPSGQFRATAEFPVTSVFITSGNAPLSPATEPETPAGSSTWFIVAIVLIAILAIACGIAFIFARRRGWGVRPTASEQIDEHASDPLLLPDDFF